MVKTGLFLDKSFFGIQLSASLLQRKQNLPKAFTMLAFGEVLPSAS